MKYLGKSLSEVLADGERRKSDQRQREGDHREKFRMQLLIAGIGCGTPTVLGLWISTVVFECPFWVFFVTLVTGLALPCVIFLCRAGVLSSALIGGVGVGLPSCLLIYWTCPHPGYLAGGKILFQFLAFVFCGLGASFFAGGLFGFLRDRIDDDHLLI